jgi:uncharacterized protein (DUF305 family)
MVLAGVISAQSPSQTPPIFHPGAPGQPAREISAGEAVTLSRTTYSAADVVFMQHMIVHHAQAVEMVELLRAQGADATVKKLGERIALSQEAEMAVMRDWLTVRGQPVETPGMSGGAHAGMDHATHGGPGAAPSAAPDEAPVMPGMLSLRQMRDLAAARGDAFDKLFLEGMIQHHQGALDMVDALMATPDAAEDPTLSDFTASVVGDQSAEILRMQTILSDL